MQSLLLCSGELSAPPFRLEKPEPAAHSVQWGQHEQSLLGAGSSLLLGGRHALLLLRSRDRAALLCHTVPVALCVPVQASFATVMETEFSSPGIQIQRWVPRDPTLFMSIFYKFRSSRDG